MMPAQFFMTWEDQLKAVMEFYLKHNIFILLLIETTLSVLLLQSSFDAGITCNVFWSVSQNRSRHKNVKDKNTQHSNVSVKELSHGMSMSA